MALFIGDNHKTSRAVLLATAERARSLKDIGALNSTGQMAQIKLVDWIVCCAHKGVGIVG